ncbi:hypothetical protein, partial [Allobaculum mucilyticum]|uniref:hypothetical protein n=1 Tax=Allobaculum mucilyticum TaxID=2834459 RepID=UPI001E4A1A6B
MSSQVDIDQNTEIVDLLIQLVLRPYRRSDRKLYQPLFDLDFRLHIPLVVLLEKLPFFWIFMLDGTAAEHLDERSTFLELWPFQV